jgi:ketosteroid isomerase-like protein
MRHERVRPAGKRGARARLRRFERLAELARLFKTGMSELVQTYASGDMVVLVWDHAIERSLDSL